MHKWKIYILKSNYFSNAQERLKGMILSLILLASIVLLLMDVYGSLKGEFIIMAWVEIPITIICTLLYVFFPRFISLKKAMNIYVGLIIFLILLSLTLPGYNQAFVLFVLAIIPASIFFLLGFERGRNWSITIVIFVLLSTLNAYMKWVPPVFNADLLLQVSFAYIVITLFFYMVERERVGYEKRLDSIIEEKNILLKEVHHRAKNNLQTIMGLLESQAMRTKHVACKEILRSQRHRLQSMSLLHENLAHETSYEKVNMSNYLTQIVNNLQKTTKHTILIETDELFLDMPKGISLGLLLNEAVSNAIEHAYDKDSIGKIKVDMQCLNDHCILSVEDHGKGFDDKVSYNSLGLVLMEDIVHFFPESELIFDFESGTKVIAKINI